MSCSSFSKPFILNNEEINLVEANLPNESELILCHYIESYFLLNIFLKFLGMDVNFEDDAYFPLSNECTVEVLNLNSLHGKFKCL